MPSPESLSSPRLFPLTWRILIAFALIAAFALSRIDEAASYICLFVTAIVAMLVPLIRYARHGAGKLSTRALPLIGWLVFVGTLSAIVRVDDLTGNFVPTRLAFRWQPRHDELLTTAPATQLLPIDLTPQSSIDFPEFLGPGRRAYVEVDLADDWTADPPQLVWEQPVGAGWSGFVAVNGYAVTMEQRGVDELVTCYEIATGKLMWSVPTPARHATVPGGVGPRSTPTIDRGYVYSLGATGTLLCIDGGTGKVRWQKDLLAETNTTVEEDVQLVAWGRAASPLLDQDRVIVPLGGPNGPSLVAYDAHDGTELWRGGNHQVSYASPLIATLDGVRQIVIVCEDFVCGHDAASGKPLWEFPWPGKSNGNASCSQPVVVSSDQLFLSKGYARGATVLQIAQTKDGAWAIETKWHRRTVMKTKFTNVVSFQQHIFGLDDTRLSCIALEGGKRVWTKRAGYGHGQVLRVGRHLLVQAESGKVALVALDTAQFRELTQFQPLTGKTWNNPCVFGAHLLVRNGEQAACYRLPLQ